MDSYLQEHAFNDLNYVATLGFTNEDIKKLVKKIEQVAQVEYGNRFDALIQVGDNVKGTTVYTNESFDNKVNKIELVDGTVPVADDECLVDNKFTACKK